MYNNYNTITIPIASFLFLIDNPPFDVYQRMVKRVRELFPDYLENPYFKEDDFNRTLLKLIDKQLTPEQFQEIGKMVLQYCYTSENMKYN